ncbi:MAG: FAD/NAD(P)-binding protein [Pseudomonadota bacterium]|nr:FAD/NAD(P)-binding protein [Pseudomonadota bacterium]
MRSDGAAAVIIGGGYSGTMVAAELARRGVPSMLVDGSGREGKGTAFSTPEAAHLLNVVAGRMGAWADKPEDFAEAVAQEGYEPHDYVPRRRYGEYLSNILNEARATGLVSLMSGEARTAERSADGWTVTLADGSRIQGQSLVLAQGNQPPAPPPLARGLPPELFVNDPWNEAGRKAIVKGAGSGGDVLLIGTGLTMVDVVLSLDEARLRGRITTLSRRGLMPQPHAEHGVAPVTLEELPKGSLKRLWRWLLNRGAAVGWRAAMDSLRPHNQALWQSLSETDQRRFLRHVQPWWNVHRHRIAPDVAGRIKRLMQIGQLEVLAGRVTDMWTDGRQLDVAIRRRGQRQVTDHRFALVVNCTGPLGSIAATGDPLLMSLFEQGLAKPDALDLGLEVDANSRIAGSDNAWAIGPLTKGKYWEIVAVPDIRGQVAQVAYDITKELKP